MRDQYAGDISDLIKLSLLRSLTGPGRRLGIAWYYVENYDGRPDGRHLEWREDAKWHELDRELANELAALPDRSVSSLQALPVYPRNTSFFSEAVPSSRERPRWADRMRSSLDNANLVFLDPDNGLGRPSRKHATIDDIANLRRSGRTVCFIVFPGRTHPHDRLVEHLHSRLLNEARANSAATLRTSVSLLGRNGYLPRSRWFTLVDPAPSDVEQLDAFARRLAAMPRTRADVFPRTAA
jgi:hypothetical protein